MQGDKSSEQSLKERLHIRYKPTGFRVSWTDLSVITFCALVTWIVYYYAEVGPMLWLPAVTLFHFFLFCNVFRIPRKLELLWAGLFVVNVAAFSIFLPSELFGMGLSGSFWFYVLACQTPITIFFIVIAIFLPTYHGIGAKSRVVGQTETKEREV
jgi:hypothetical protein